MNADELSGRALDAMIARRLFGHQVQDREDLRTAHREYDYNATPDRPTATWLNVPEYSRNMGASVRVELKAAELGWKRRATPPVSITEVTDVALEHTDGRTVTEHGLFGEALCQAALRAGKQ